MSKIPTAKELYEKYNMSSQNGFDKAIELAVEFAKLHVQAALEAAANMGKKTWDWTTEECNSIIEDAYPENLIQ